MPSYNHENTTESSICSMQYHKFSKIEIILKIVNDINNKGILYSRSMGVLLWVKYIFNLDNDNDDFHFVFDIFDFIYKRAGKDYLDIIGFLTLIFSSKTILNETKIDEDIFFDIIYDFTKSNPKK